MLNTSVRFSHLLLKECVQPGDTAIDATMGNGNDTCLLAELVGKTGQLYSFDIQELALNNTAARLHELALHQRVQLIHDGHQNLGNYLATDAPLKAAIFNLGYLPQSNKSIITLPETTKLALDECLARLVPRGRIIIVAYLGHVGGDLELTTVKNYCQALPQEQYNVLNYQFINQEKMPPVLFCIEKRVLKQKALSFH
ncbi:MAG: tRNA (mnm(5)s(2)U34)-methyltransferase [Enterococcus sp.]